MSTDKIMYRKFAGAEIDATTQFMVDLLLNELKRAEKQHPAWPTDPIHAAAIVGEESGELTQACLNFLYFPGDNVAQKKQMLEEAVQVGAMAIRFLMGYQTYVSSKSKHDMDDEVQ